MAPVPKPAQAMPDYKTLMEHATSLVLLRPDLIAEPQLKKHKKTSKDYDEDGGMSMDDEIEAEGVVGEMECLRGYFESMKIENADEKVFLEEIFLGCVRHVKILKGTIAVVNGVSGRGVRPQYERAVLTVLGYLILFRINEIGLDRLTGLVRGLEPRHIASFLSVLSDPVAVEGALRGCWCRVLDASWVHDNLVTPLLENASNIHKLSKEFLEKLNCGMTVAKSTKPPTESKPFLLTKPRPRRLPEPTERISTVPKARPVPKTVYEGSSEQAALEKTKVENRHKTQTLYEEAQRMQFHAAKVAAAAKKAASQTLPPKPTTPDPARKRIIARPAPTFKEVAPVKLTTSAILRENALSKKRRDEEVKEMNESEVRLRDNNAYGNWREAARVKEEEDKRIELERRRLQVQLAHEDAIVAREGILIENRERVQEAKELKEVLARAAEEAKHEADLEKRRKVEQVQDLQENINRAKQRVIDENLRRAAEVELQSQQLREQAYKQHEEDRIRKTELIAQIRLLEQRNVTPAGFVVKTVDLTETAGLGLLGEMSVLELQERLIRAKTRLIDTENTKRQTIMLAKQKKLEAVAAQLQEIDRERYLRKHQRDLKRVNADGLLSRPISVMSSASNCSSRTGGEREALIERDVGLRDLADKLASRRAARLATRAATKLSAHQMASVGSDIGSECGSDVSRRRDMWCELGEAAGEYESMKRVGGDLRDEY
ncbi:hypothetical protein SmJEL517_g03488 [Synchytrium microbalum]|uniref:Uncharacterized protein n=1 Tax=Synchytrium microbalum TaxID=1806994 RepID=A0A507C2T5_9FUNG|nr:uncharacterized protein SmJEL517_g03488 [Synchytrium microbalum]TPX33741.1 hypothetical protein SmJEL517_g03488 [Synchytrium microbalum]